MLKTVCALVLCSSLVSFCAIEYHPELERTAEEVACFNETDDNAERYLAYRDLPELFKQYTSGPKALDFGAGTGISTKLLLNNNFSVCAADVSTEMAKQFRINYPEVPLYMINNNELPFAAHSFDLVFSSLVILEIASKEALKEYFKAAHGILKKDGIFVILNTSDTAYTKNWFLFGNDYPENKNLKSGDLATIFQYEGNIKFSDYYWLECDIKALVEEVGFEMITIHHPLGKSDEPYAWRDELEDSPFVLFVARAL